MDANNYYFLLGLSIDPPENDPQVIEDAIQKKQAEWSRLRNHPTKGTQAQQYIGMLPEIRKVMSDDALRRKEAAAAQRLSAQNEKKIRAKVDRQVALLLSKGRITKAEQSKLADLNGVPLETIAARVSEKEQLFLINYHIEELIRTGMRGARYQGRLAKKFGLDPERVAEWITNKEQEKNRKIEVYLRRCHRRGYITRGEIKALSQLYLVSEENVIRRNRCMIRKKGTPTQDLPEALDKSTEKIIEDHLKIIGKSSLYDFLDAPQDADLKLLQDATQEKDLEVRKISQKDAKATAFGTLVGHCISIFKHEKNRMAYDRSLTLSRLQELNADMEVAGLSKKVHAEYVAILMKSALKLGMDIDEARRYMEKYFKKQRWKVGKPKPFIARRRPFYLRPVPVAVILVLMLTTSLSIAALQKRLVAQEFTETVALAAQAAQLERKAAILQGFVLEYPESDFATEMKKRILDIQQQIETRDYDDVRRRFEQLYQSGAYEEARDVIKAHMAKCPEGEHRSALEKQLSMANRAIADRDYAVLETALDACETQETWRRCIALCSGFSRTHPESRHVEKVSGRKQKYLRIIQGQADLATLQKRSAEKGADLEAARQVYLDYLQANPELPVTAKKRVVAEIEIYDRQIERFHQAEKTLTHLASADYGLGNEALAERIDQVKAFMEQYPPEWYGEEAAILLRRLEKQQALKTRRRRTEAENRDWKAVAADAQNRRLSPSARIARVEAFLLKHPESSHAAKAKLLLATLNKHQKVENARKAQERASALRRQEEEKRISHMLKRLSGSFVDHHNGTVTDKRTGLMWCTFDASLAENRCFDHRDALRYVRRLGTGGYRDWRIPSPEELQQILETPPLFPASRSTFFWTSELFWHGWNEMAYILRPAAGAAWQKEPAEVEQCGSVLAVRN